MHPVRHNPSFVVALELSLFALPSFGLDLQAERNVGVLFIAGIIMALQFAMIIGLQRSRLKNKDAKNSLKIQQISLEQEILERTESLRQKNLELEAAIHNYKQIALQLQDTKRHLQTMINSVPEILVGVDEKGRINYWNTAAYDKTHLPFDKALGMHVLKALPQLPISHEQLTNIIKNQLTHVNQHIQQMENDELKFYDLRIYPLSNSYNFGAVIQLNDITKRRQFENILIQNEKMSSLGELAAGIAHEINNPLGIILHNTQNIIRRTSTELAANREAAAENFVSLENIRGYLHERGVHEFLANIQDAGERASAIVANMLEFARSNHSEKDWVDVKKLVEQTTQLHIKSNLAQENGLDKVRIITTFSPDLPPLFSSASELQQVLLNLLHNAHQALSSTNYEKPNELLITLTTYTNKKELIIEVGDNGPGIKENIKDHIFEPFFTTKEVGKGTGLGLSVSYFIITEHHQGSISVMSQFGKGTTFKISLPLTGNQPT